MAFWDRWFSREPAPLGSTTLEATPGLRVELHVHELRDAAGPVPCWTWASRGLARHRQKELVLTIRRAAHEGLDRAPAEVVDLLRTIDHLAAQGRLVDVGGFTEFGARPFLRPEVRGIGYRRATPMPGVTLTGPSLEALLLMGREVQVAQLEGLSRVVARLGQATRIFPCPPWNDLDRPPTPCGGESILSKVRMLVLPGLSVRQRREKLVRVTTLAPARATLAGALKVLPADAAMFLLAELHPAATACQVWVPGQTGPAAIAAPGFDPGSEMAACFLGDVPEGSGGLRLFEDGVALLTSAEESARLRRALVADEPTALELDGGVRVQVEPEAETFVNPIDGGTYVAWDGWVDHPREVRRGPIREVILLSPQGAFEAHLGVERLSALIQAVEALVASAGPGEGELRVQVELVPGERPRFELGVRPQALAGLLERVRSGLAGLEAPAVPIRLALQVVFDLRP